MFTKAKKQTFETRVTVNTVGERGEHKTGTFGAEFKRCTQQQIEDMVDEQWADGAVLDEYLVRVWDVGDADGNPLDAEEAMQVVLEDPAATAAASSRFLELMRGDAGKGRTSRKRRRTG